MSYDLIVCGTGFASSFFLKKWLQKRPRSRILVLERGTNFAFGDQIAQRKNSSTPIEPLFTKSGLESKDWLFTIGMGGGSNCWWGQTPRLWPEDFQLLTKFGVGYDWPIGYSDLEPYYEEAENIIQVAGPEIAPYPRRGACPQPAHRLSGFDESMMASFPSKWFAAPSARSSLGTANRGKCCANGVCGICPVDAKFRVMNELYDIFEDPTSVEVRTGAEVLAVDVEGGRATGVTWREGGAEKKEKADLVFLGMNAIFNPYVLLNSGDNSPLTGKRVNEQASVKLVVDFEYVSGFNGGTHITGLGYMYYGGDQRRERASCLIENYNAPALLRNERGKWTSRAMLKIVAENIPDDKNEIRVGDSGPIIHFEDHSAYAKRALDEVLREFQWDLAQVSRIENVSTDGSISPTEGHILGTTMMSLNPAEGVVDGFMQHHKIANLIVAGSGVFPSSSVSNPSLTIAALSLRTADKLA